LDIDKFANSKLREFPPIAGTFNSAERQSRIRSDHAVYENLPGFDLASQSFGKFEI
jgi:hypothetical protein